MFTRYLRSYPWWLQFILFLLMVYILFWLSIASVLYFIPAFKGLSIQTAINTIQNLNDHSPRKLIDAAILFQLITSVCMFMLPPLVFAYLAHPRPVQYLGLRAPGKPIHWLLVVVMFVGIIPVFLSMENWLSHFNLSSGLRAEQEENERITDLFLNMPNLGAFLKTFFVVAIVPAIGEELFFRGIIMRFIKKRSRNMVMPIIITALAFAFVHSNVYGFPSIFMAGVLLAIIYYYTGSILCSMLGHLINNGLQIVIIYLANDNPAIKNMMGSNSLPAYVPIIGAVIFSIGFYFLWKTRTPLPKNWAEDFTPEELSEKAY